MRVWRRRPTFPTPHLSISTEINVLFSFVLHSIHVCLFLWFLIRSAKVCLFHIFAPARATPLIHTYTPSAIPHISLFGWLNRRVLIICFQFLIYCLVTYREGFPLLLELPLFLTHEHAHTPRLRLSTGRWVCISLFGRCPYTVCCRKTYVWHPHFCALCLFLALPTLPFTLKSHVLTPFSSFGFFFSK